MFKWLKNFLARLWKIIKVVLVVILICLVIYFTAGLALPAAIPIVGGLSGYGAALACLGAAFLIDSDTAGEISGKVVDGVKEVASDVINAAADVVSGGVSSILTSTPVLIAGAAALAYFLFFRRKSGDEEAEAEDNADSDASMQVSSGGDDLNGKLVSKSFSYREGGSGTTTDQPFAYGL